MKPFQMWVILDKRGRLMRYTTGEPVIWGKREDAHYDALNFDPKRRWRPQRVTVSIGATRE